MTDKERSSAGSAAQTGRRERKKLDTQRRIIAVATELFTAKGYSAVTTQEIAEAADIGAGTLFRYAANKAELLLMVLNQRITTVDVTPAAGAVEAILALVGPLFAAAAAQPENMTAYQREVLFGTPGPARDEALARIRGLERTIREVLDQHVATTPTRAGVDVERAATVIFSVLYLKLVRLELGSVDRADVDAMLRADVTGLIAELFDVRSV